MSETVSSLSLEGKIAVLSGFAFPSNGFNQLEGLPLIRIRDLASSTTEVKFRGKYDHNYLVRRGDVLIGMDGDFDVHRWSGDDALLNQRVCKITTVSSGIDQCFLYWYLKPKIAEIHRKTPQTTVRHLSAKDIYSISVPPLSAPEQRAVAQILETLDTAVRQTEAIVEKLKQVKQGLLHDLLTRGVDANGELRRPYEQAPNLYRQSPLGWIPREWDVMALGNIANSSVIGPFGSNLVASDYRSWGVPVVFVRDVRETGFEWNSHVYVSKSKAAALAVHEVIPGDILATKMGLPPCVSAVYPDWMPAGIITADILRFRVDRTRYRPTWVSYCINETAVVKQVEAITAGVTRPKVTLRDARNLLLRIPLATEQDRILELLDVADRKIRLESYSVSKLKANKLALMEDLLTGRVRVTALLEQ